MKVIQGQNNVHSMLQMYKACLDGLESKPRDMLVRNVPNMVIVFDVNQPVLTTFFHRNLNLNYCKREWLWYLGADPKDDSIAEHAKAWEKLKQTDGSYLSNYGQYMFAGAEGESQFEYVLRQLRSDEHTRRASMVFLKREHLFESNVDVVCTYAINFTIVNGVLDMTVMMRSNDVVFGFTNDAFCFQQLYEFVYALTKVKHEGLQRGQYTHFTNSMHVYERHYEMLGKILRDPRTVKVDVPRPTAKEALDMFRSRGKEAEGDYFKWITSLD